MRELTFTVPDEWDGVMAKRFLRGYCKVSYHLLVKLKRVPQGITMNGALLRTIDRVKRGETVRLFLPEDQNLLQAADIPLRIVWEDSDLLILDKPPHLPVHPSRGHEKDTLANGVAAYMVQKGEPSAFRVLNRLDQDTSGLVLTAKNSHAAARLSRQVEKRYFAVIEGVLSGSGTIDAPLRCREGHGIQREIGEGGERAVTHWYAVESRGGYTLLCIRLETGRTHQIRAHFSCGGFPLAGDAMYGGNREQIGRQALHCGYLRFCHPVSGEEIRLACPFPEDMAEMMKRLGFSAAANSSWIFSWAERTQG